MGLDHEGALRRLIVKDAITEVYNRYCRGVDLPDLDLIKSAYWPDAIDDHIVFHGNAMVFAEKAVAVLKSYRSSQHFYTNLSVNLIDDDHADAECYYYVYHQLAPDPGGGPSMMTLGGGRYIDRFACRDGEWRILTRRVTMELNDRRALADPAE